MLLNDSTKETDVKRRGKREQERLGVIEAELRRYNETVLPALDQRIAALEARKGFAQRQQQETRTVMVALVQRVTELERRMVQHAHGADKRAGEWHTDTDVVGHAHWFSAYADEGSETRPG